MAHLDRLYSDVEWLGKPTITGDDLSYIDENTKVAVNGDDGGPWAPASPIVIGGRGVVAAAVWAFQDGRIRTPLNGGRRIVHGDNDVIELAPGNPHRVHVPLSLLHIALTLGPPAVRWILGADLIPSAPGGGSANRDLVRAWFPLQFDAVHDGAVLKQAILRFVVTVSRGANPPEHLPRFRIVGVDLDGGVTNLRTANVDPSGYQIFAPAPVSGAAWYNGGAPQSFAVAIDSGTVIDTERYAYFLDVINERGANSSSGNKFLSLACEFEAADLRPQ